MKTDAICGNSTVNNADCFLPPYPPFITNPASSSASVSVSKPSARNSTMTTPTPTKSVPVTASTTVAVTSATTGGAGIPTLGSGVGEVFIPGLSVVCGIVVMMVFGLLF